VTAPEQAELDALWRRIYADTARAQLLTVGLLARAIRAEYPEAVQLVLQPRDDRADHYWPSEVLDAAGAEVDMTIALQVDVGQWVGDLEYDGDWTVYADLRDVRDGSLLLNLADAAGQR
jgi:hypothetical protein